ncbi:MAG: flagellar hook-basal body protein [Spirochaetales bacterium]|nr:flagellar hook-basal body protein [Spirochaetales bacterium]
MIRGIYTGASGMQAEQNRMDVVANNLANADLTGFKRDTVSFKAFPELLLHRFDDDGVRKLPMGSTDIAPIVGKLGTGVETNEVYTDFSQGSFKQTENSFDFALEGKGFFAILTPEGERYTRNGSFTLGPESLLVTHDGFPVLGESGELIKIKANNFTVDQDGKIFINRRFQENDERLVSMTENEWEDTILLDKLKIVDFTMGVAGNRGDRYIKKQGNSFWRETEDSGPASVISDGRRPKVHQGFVETANINPVTEMVQMIEVNRAYEANQKTIQTHDQLLGRLVNDVMRV